MKHSLITRATMATLLVANLSACSAAKWREVAPHTGDPDIEQQTVPTQPVVKPPVGPTQPGGPTAPTGPTQPSQPPVIKEGQPGYVVPERLRGRETCDQPGEKAPVLLEQGDRVEIIDPNTQGDCDLIKVTTPKYPRPIYVPPQYISPVPLQLTPEQRDANKYFMIQNVATEKLRVYERCEGLDSKSGKPCSHKLILETDMVAGENTPSGERQTILGSFRISKWFKFYEDSKHNFPSWYHPRYPELPPPGASWEAWLSKSLLPEGRGIARGKFGWYTAHLEPNAHAQWTHGTVGWGADKDRFIQLTRDQAINDYSDPRSAGCSRVENQAIAFIREILPVGTKVIKVYAKEASRADLSNAPNKRARWDWILTKDGYQVDGSKAGRKGVLARGTTEDKFLEQGYYSLDQSPDPVPFRAGSNGHVNSNGNLYDLAESSLNGYLVVDEGRLVNYGHPRELMVGGYSDRHLPAVVISNDDDMILPDTQAIKDRVLQGEGPNDGKQPDGTVLNQKPTSSAATSTKARTEEQAPSRNSSSDRDTDTKKNADSNSQNGSDEDEKLTWQGIY